MSDEVRLRELRRAVDTAAHEARVRELRLAGAPRGRYFDVVADVRLTRGHTGWQKRIASRYRLARRTGDYSKLFEYGRNAQPYEPFTLTAEQVRRWRGRAAR